MSSSESSSEIYDDIDDDNGRVIGFLNIDAAVSDADDAVIGSDSDSDGDSDISDSSMTKESDRDGHVMIGTRKVLLLYVCKS